MIFDPPPKSRRRVVARFLWPTLIASALIVAVVVSAAGEETRAEIQYLEEIRSHTDELAQSGISIANVMARLDEIGREEFTTVFDNALSDLDVATEFAADEPPAESLVPVWALYRQAVTSWEEGVSGLSEAILLAADDPEDATVYNATGDALAELRAGDALYRDLQAEFDRDEIPEPVSPLADVHISPADTLLTSQSVSYVNAARRSTNKLGLRPSLKVSQVVSDPKWETNVDAEAVIPATDTVSFSAVITNSGNVASKPESITMTFTGGVEPIVAEAEVPVLQPNGQTTISFDPVDVIPETLYEVMVELKLSNPDADITDNSLRVRFTVNPS